MSKEKHVPLPGSDATFLVVHDLDEDDYIEQYCPFCGEEHDQVEEDVLLNEDWD